MNSIECIEQPTTQCNYDFKSELETQLTSSPCIDDTSMKSGEIFRNSKGEFSFLCCNCGFTFQDLGEIVNHINSHFDTTYVKWEVETATPEFVICTEVTETAVIPSQCITLPEFNIVTLEPKSSDVAVRRRGRKRKNTTATSEPKALNVSVRKREEKNIGQSTLDEPQHCPICELWCQDFRDHLKTSHDVSNRIYQCFMCGAFFKQWATLKNHISCSNHTKVKCYQCVMEPPVMNQSDPRRHKCLFCKQWFSNHIEFKIHFKQAHNKDADYFFHKRSNCNVFTCYVCEREFPLRYSLTAHMKIHHDKYLRHQCPTCGRRFRTFGILTQHLKRHEGKTYKCDQCDKEFPFQTKLNNHRWTHKTELNYKCQICSKAFKIRKYLSRHMAVHQDVKRYVCRYDCKASFSFTSGRRAHEKSQHKAV